MVKQPIWFTALLLGSLLAIPLAGHAQNSAAATGHTAPAAHPHEAPAPIVTIEIAAYPLRDGVHLNASVTNLSVATQEVHFATNERLVFRAMRDTCVEWISDDHTPIVHQSGRLIFGPLETKSYSAFWPGAAAIGPGPVTITARLMSDVTVDSAPSVIPEVAFGMNTPAATAESPDATPPAGAGACAASPLPSPAATSMPLPTNPPGTRRAVTP